MRQRHGYSSSLLRDLLSEPVVPRRRLGPGSEFLGAPGSEPTLRWGRAADEARCADCPTMGIGLKRRWRTRRARWWAAGAVGVLLLGGAGVYAWSADAATRRPGR
ncbi:hypothetical protein GCM10027614_05760 [Micromonospora vulcania]